MTTEIMLNPRFSLAVLGLGLVLLAGCNKPASSVAPNPAQQANANAVQPPIVVRKVHADFPKQLWDKPGTVTVAAVVGVDGKVAATKIMSSPHPELNQLAVDAVKQWQFNPAQQNGKPVATTVAVSVSFQPPVPGQPAASPTQKP